MMIIICKGKLITSSTLKINKQSEDLLFTSYAFSMFELSNVYCVNKSEGTKGAVSLVTWSYRLIQSSAHCTCSLEIYASYFYAVIH
jgi:hypothetical protein